MFSSFISSSLKIQQIFSAYLSKNYLFVRQNSTMKYLFFQKKKTCSLNSSVQLKAEICIRNVVNLLSSNVASEQQIIFSIPTQCCLKSTIGFWRMWFLCIAFSLRNAFWDASRFISHEKKHSTIYL